jgi:uncharacterized repeat protein (TIGR01451 family)
MPGTMVMFDLRVTNMGNVSDTFELYFEDNDWEVELSMDMTGELAPGEWVDVNAMVYIPAGAPVGNWDTVMVYAKSMGDPDHWDAVMLKTTAMAMPPVAGFSFSPSVPLVGEEVVFTNETTGTEPIEYLWDFGDGATSTAEHPTHAYAEAGLYTVTLTATNDLGSDTFSAEITVGDLPVLPELTLELSVDPDPVVIGQPATFTAVVTNISDVTVEGVMASGVIPSFVIVQDHSDECSVDEGVLTCDLGDLEPGEVATAWVTVVFTSTGTFDFSMDVEGVGTGTVSDSVSVTVLPVVVQENRLYIPVLMRSQ